MKATIDGVVRAPSRVAMTRGFPPSITAMQQFVVPEIDADRFAHRAFVPPLGSNGSYAGSTVTLTRAGRSSRSCSR